MQFTQLASKFEHNLHYILLNIYWPTGHELMQDAAVKSNTVANIIINLINKLIKY